jgi:2-polyprenyl-3-methyl-5-hydroxy-6-metoxy-1,4-benzoquinol methylase
MNNDNGKSISQNRWKDAQKAETDSWNEVLNNSYLLEITDLYYRHHKTMGLPEVGDKRILNVADIGCGPLSMMLHFDEVWGLAVDPIGFDKKWIDRYEVHGIRFIQSDAESFLENYTGTRYQEVWMYNVLQHVKNPEFILDNLWKVGKVLRISEPCLTPITIHHPFTFEPDWYKTKLESISKEWNWLRVDWDFPYVGGWGELKKGEN